MEYKEDEEVIEMDNGIILMLRQALHIQSNPYKDERHNMFQTRSTINGKVCSIIMDGGSYANMASVGFLGCNNQQCREI